MRSTDRVHTMPRILRPVWGLALAGVAGAMLVGCSAEEAICGSDEYPVMAVGGTGGACVSDGEKPLTGYVRYPKGKVPEHVDDKWDIYWDTHTVDKNGNIIDAPDV